MLQPELAEPKRVTSEGVSASALICVSKNRKQASLAKSGPWPGLNSLLGLKQRRDLGKPDGWRLQTASLM